MGRDGGLGVLGKRPREVPRALLPRAPQDARRFWWQVAQPSLRQRLATLPRPEARLLLQTAGLQPATLAREAAVVCRMDAEMASGHSALQAAQNVVLADLAGGYAATTVAGKMRCIENACRRRGVMLTCLPEW